MQLEIFIVVINGLLDPWNKNFTPSWDNEGFTRQRENEEYEPRQLDYDTGLPIKEAVRSKYLYEMGGEGNDKDKNMRSMQQQEEFDLKEN